VKLWAYLEYMTSSSRSEAWPEERPSSSTGMAVCIRGPEEWKEPLILEGAIKEVRNFPLFTHIELRNCTSKIVFAYSFPKLYVCKKVAR
jgi:hypothetical protein